MIYFDSAAIYIESATTLQEKIAKIDAIIVALEATALTAAGNEDLTEYSLDNGQTKIKCVYRGSESIIKSIKAYEQMKQMYVNRLNGRRIRLVDSKNFGRYGR